MAQSGERVIPKPYSDYPSASDDEFALTDAVFGLDDFIVPDE
jgi:hypothetical protein